MTVVFQPKETLLKVLFDLHSNCFESFEEFRNCHNDPKDRLFMEMEELMNIIYPVHAASHDDIWLRNMQLEYQQCSSESGTKDYLMNFIFPKIAVEGDP